MDRDKLIIPQLSLVDCKFKTLPGSLRMSLIIMMNYYAIKIKTLTEMIKMKIK